MTKKKAEYALAEIGKWYKYESDAKKENYTSEQKLEMRQKFIKDSMDNFKKWMLKQASEGTPNNPLRKACMYGLGQWDGFSSYLSDGRVAISNIAVENLIRPVAIGRKNYMFKGSEEAARRGAIVYSICATAHLHGKNPRKHIKELLIKLPNMSAKDVNTLLSYFD